MFFKQKDAEGQKLRLTFGLCVHADTCALAHRCTTYSLTQQAKRNESVHICGQGVPHQKSSPRENPGTEDQRRAETPVNSETATQRQKCLSAARPEIVRQERLTVFQTNKGLKRARAPIHHLPN